MEYSLIRELSQLKRDKLVDLIVESGFKVTTVTNSRIDFEKGFREFTLYSTDVDDQEGGLTTYPNLSKFLKKNYKHKSKHSISLKDKIMAESRSVEEACSLLKWKINDCHNLKDCDIDFNIEEPLAEILYEVQIKNLAHVIIDDEVYEGELRPLLSLGKLSSKEALSQMASGDMILKIKNFK